MSPPLEPRFSWRGIVLIAISFALIGLAVLFRSHDAQSSSTHWLATSGEWKRLGTVFAVGIIVIVAAFLGSWCGYLRVAFRLRKLSQKHDHRPATPKT
ncbi:MAG TPA: hypothetical protein VF345_00385 [Chthoniobacterales bacterium]